MGLLEGNDTEASCLKAHPTGARAGRSEGGADTLPMPMSAPTP